MVHRTLMVLRTRRYAAPPEDDGRQTLLRFFIIERPLPRQPTTESFKSPA